MKHVLVTGTAGFIGYHLARLLLVEGFTVHGYDAITDYYDVTLKHRRNQRLLQSPNYSFTQALLEEEGTFERVSEEFAPDVIIHLAGQAGVRYSLENPRAYLDSNLVGTFNVLEAARQQQVKHLMMASTSSVYGANEEMPFRETDKADTQLTFYAATKKANESMAHSYAHLWKIPTTMFRFFTVYGPWGRPDMALFKFTKGIFDGTPIDIYNHGDMYRDFTYGEDLVRGIRLLMDAIPGGPETAVDGDTLSPAAPYRIVNIGNSDKVRLLDFIEAIEAETGLKAKRNYMDMQKGDVHATWANADLLKTLTGYAPQTNVREGVAQFVAWYRDYYKV